MMMEPVVWRTDRKETGVNMVRPVRRSLQHSSMEMVAWTRVT